MKRKTIFIFISVIILLLITLYFILAKQIPAVKMRIIVFTIWAFAEFYLWFSIVKTFKITNFLRPKRLIFTILYWLPAVSIIIMIVNMASIGLHDINKTFYLTMVGVCVIQYIIKFLISGFLICYDIVTYFFKSKFNRDIWKKYVLYFSLFFYIISLLLMGYGTFYGAFNFQIQNIEIKTKKKIQLPKNQNELKIVQISDLHLASWRNSEEIEKVVALINIQDPDIVVVTGDLVQFVSSEMIEYLPILSKISSKFGVYSVLGNHDYGRYANFANTVSRKKDVAKLIEYQRGFGWKVLLNENKPLYFDNIFSGITMAGVEYYSPKKMFMNEGSLQKTFQKVNNNNFVIFLSHNPEAWDAVIAQNFPADLTLSGHTHGMQLGINTEFCKWSPASLLYKQWGGLYMQGARNLYVNVGLGAVGFPARVGMSPEITVIKLKVEN